MLANVSGVVMELKNEFDEKKNQLATVTAMVFQKGEKTLLPIKKMPEGIAKEGTPIKDIPVRIHYYNFNGSSGVSCIYTG